MVSTRSHIAAYSCANSRANDDLPEAGKPDIMNNVGFITRKGNESVRDGKTARRGGHGAFRTRFRNLGFNPDTAFC
jgi:hypothetical protein